MRFRRKQDKSTAAYIGNMERKYGLVQTRANIDALPRQKRLAIYKTAADALVSRGVDPEIAVWTVRQPEVDIAGLVCLRADELRERADLEAEREQEAKKALYEQLMDKGRKSFQRHDNKCFCSTCEETYAYVQPARWG